MQLVIVEIYSSTLASQDTAWTPIKREENRTEFNLRSGKCEAEVRLIIEDCARRVDVLYY